MHEAMKHAWHVLMVQSHQQVKKLHMHCGSVTISSSAYLKAKSVD